MAKEKNTIVDTWNITEWVELIDDNTIKGEFHFHQGDDSTFSAKRA